MYRACFDEGISLYCISGRFRNIDRWRRVGKGESITDEVFTTGKARRWEERRLDRCSRVGERGKRENGYVPARTRELVLSRALLAIKRGRVLHALLFKPRHSALLGVRLRLLARRGDRARVGRGERVRRLDAIDRSAEDGLRVRHVLARSPKVGVERAELWREMQSGQSRQETRKQ